MSLNKIVAGDFGYEIELTFKDTDTDEVEDLSSFTTAQYIHVRAPNGSVVQLTGAFSATGTDGKVKATVTTGKVPESWSKKRCAARIRVTRTGGQLTSEWEEFTPQ